MNLKTLIVIALSVPFIASAGTTCFKTNSPIVRYLPNKYYLPATICLEDIAESNAVNALSIESADGSLPKQVTVTELSRHNEDRYAFVAEKALVDIDYSANGACGEIEKAVLRIEGQSNYNKIAASDLKISLEVVAIRDTCHSPEITRSATYELVK